jgi:Holliday junction resolvase
MSSQYNYERELKGILSGDDDVLRKVTRSFDEYTKAQYYLIKKQPFLVIRAAGSFGEDLVALRSEVGFPIEVKASKKALFHFSNSKRLKEQQADFMAVCKRTGTLPIYAFRLKNVRGQDPWRIFTIDIKIAKGIMKLIYDRLPKLQKTSNGHYKMPWKDGMPLSKFIDYLCR